MTELELMTAHCSALYVHNGHSDLVCINDWLRRPAPAFWLGITPEGMLWRFREDVSGVTRRRFERLIAEENGDEEGPLPGHHDAYRALLNGQDAVAGPTYWLRTLAPAPGHRVERVSEGNAGLLRDSELEAWIPDIPHQQPMFVSLENGRAAAVCASVRITSIAHGAGVETLPRYRRHGHAAAVVGAWAQALLRAGIMPLYSTSWDNVASQGVARRLGFEAFGWEYRIG